MAVSDVAPSDDLIWPEALRRGTRLLLSLRVELTVGAGGSLPEPSLLAAVAGSLLPPDATLVMDSGVSGGATSSPSSLSFAANAVSTSWASEVVSWFLSGRIACAHTAKA